MNFLLPLLSTSLLMSFIILMAMAIFSFFPKLFSGKTRYYIWIIILLGLIIPFRPILGDGLIQIRVPEKQWLDFEAESELSLPQEVLSDSASPTAQDLKAAEPAQNNGLWASLKDSFSLMHLIIGIWLLGVIFSFSKHLYHYRQFKKMIRRWAYPVEDLASLELFEIVKEEMGLAKKKIQLLICPSISTPMLTGFLRPAVLLPEKEIAADEMELILEHELTHYKHKDLYINLLGTLAISLHWFNPIVYLCYPSIQGDGEVCCDEAVLINRDSDYRQFYGEVIISMIEKNSKHQVAFTTCFYAKKLSIKRRLIAIMETNNKKKLSILAVSVILALTIITGSVFALANPPKRQNISPEKAKSIALKDAGVMRRDANFIKAILENKNGIAVYDIEFFSGQTEYDYDIDAITGNILKKDKEIENFDIPQTENKQSNPTAKKQQTPAKTTQKPVNKTNQPVQNGVAQNTNSQNLISLDKAKTIALTDAGLKANQVSFIKAKLESENGKAVYDIEFYLGQTEYDYEIDAQSGQILEKDRDVENFVAPKTQNNQNTQNTQNNQNTQNTNNKPKNGISLEDAKAIALKHSGFSANQVVLTVAKADTENGKPVFDIEYTVGQTEYQYEIDAKSGQILDFDKDMPEVETDHDDDDEHDND